MCGILRFLQELCRSCKCLGKGSGEERTHNNVIGKGSSTKIHYLAKDSYAMYHAYGINYLQPQGCRHLLEKDAFVLMVDFLLGPSPKNSAEADSTQQTPRRWSSNQVKEFGPLHCTLSLLVRNTDISMFESESDADDEQVNPYMIPAKFSELHPPSDGMHQALFTIECSKRFIREVLCGCVNGCGQITTSSI